jgi:hypothetical protein
MKTLINALFSCGLICIPVSAEIPRKEPLERYSTLWSESPFTSKLKESSSLTTDNPLMNYSLTGIAPIGNGYRVTLMPKNDPTKRIFVHSDDQKAPFKIIKVYRSSTNLLETMVEMSAGDSRVMMCFGAS